MSSDLAPALTTPKKPYRQILFEEIAEGRQELRRSALGLLISSLSAGLDVGFSLFLMAAVGTQLTDLSDAWRALLVANAYTVGFIFVTLGRSELFTEHTTLAVLPVLGGHASLLDLGRLWLLVFAGNLAGTTAFAGLTVLIGPTLGIIEPAELGKLARRMVEHSGEAIFLSALLAGWLMGLLTWLVTAARDTISQIVVVWLVTLTIGFTHLHHAIVTSVEILAGVFAGQGVTLADYGRFLGWATLGNAVGGAVFVAVLKYGHATQGGADEAAGQDEPLPEQHPRRRAAS